MAKKLTRQDIALRRMEVAIVDLYDAKALLDKACQRLSPVVGANPFWREIRDLSNRVKEAMRSLDARLHYPRNSHSGPHEFEIDREPSEKWDAEYMAKEGERRGD